MCHVLRRLLFGCLTPPALRLWPAILAIFPAMHHQAAAKMSDENVPQAEVDAVRTAAEERVAWLEARHREVGFRRRREVLVLHLSRDVKNFGDWNNEPATRRR